MIRFVTKRRCREAVAVLFGLMAVTLIVLHQQAADLYAVPDRGDPIFSMWRMAWVQHQLVTDPRHLFDANIFYPLPATLTYSDSMILPSVAAAPLAWAHVHPVVAYNLVLLGALVLSGVSAYWLVRGLGYGPVAAWITAVTFTISPFRINHLSHLELQMTMWMPVGARPRALRYSRRLDARRAWRRRRAVLFEFPVHAQPDRFAENLPYMYFSIWHWTPMVNGYSGFNPRSYAELLERTSGFPGDDSLSYLERAGVTHVTLHCALWEPEVCTATMNRLDSSPRVHRIARADWYGAPTSLYELRR